MSHFATIDRGKSMSAVLKVVGVGGGGCNAIESMIKRGLQGVEYVSVNTDAQVLRSSNAAHKIQVGANITRGLGAGADPNVGKKSIEEDREKNRRSSCRKRHGFCYCGYGRRYRYWRGTNHSLNCKKYRFACCGNCNQSHSSGKVKKECLMLSRVFKNLSNMWIV